MKVGDKVCVTEMERGRRKEVIGHVTGFRFNRVLVDGVPYFTARVRPLPEAMQVPDDPYEGLESQ